MCGIIGYIGKKNVTPILVDGLMKVEYRGYDSAGIAIVDNNKNMIFEKNKGRVSGLIKKLSSTLKSNITGIGIGHTRWATHGVPNQINAHPQVSNNAEILLVHNGIIENYRPLRRQLISKGYQFTSDTDTEVLVCLIEDIQKEFDLDGHEALKVALQKVIGAYAIVMIDVKQPDKLYAARRSSPLAIGIGKDEFFICSDVSSFIEHTKKVVYLDDDEIASVTRNRLYLSTINGEIINPSYFDLDYETSWVSMDGYESFMQKEIFQQPLSLYDSMRGRLIKETEEVLLSGVKEHSEEFRNAKRIIIVSCGSSWHAGLYAEYLFEEILRIPVEVEYASEFRYRNPIMKNGDIVLAISQSGETADTIAALKLAKSRGAFAYGITNVIGSTISRITNTGSYLHVGPEIGVASTKAFTGQMMILCIMGLMIARIREEGWHSNKNLIKELCELPKKVEEILNLNEEIERISSNIFIYENAIFLGRGYDFPVALEGALKLKEISYIHAEGYPAAEMKHGPIALIDEEMPVFVIATNSKIFDKVVSNIQEVKARGGKVIAVVTQNNDLPEKIVDYTIVIPEVSESIAPLLSIIPLQLFAYHIAKMRKCDVDKPRNLAKSVTVE